MTEGILAAWDRVFGARRVSLDEVVRGFRLAGVRAGPAADLVYRNANAMEVGQALSGVFGLVKGKSNGRRYWCRGYPSPNDNAAAEQLRHIAEPY